MRRLTIVPCTASWEAMPADGDGRFCERCDLRVTNVATLDDAGVDALLERAASGKACARFELVGGRPRIRHGLAAGLLVTIALSGCITPGSSIAWGFREAAFAEFIELNLGDVAGGVISGVVHDEERVVISNALVILQSTALPEPREAFTDDRGFYSFAGLPSGSYTVMVLAMQDEQRQILTLAEGARVRAHFELNSKAGWVGGILFDPNSGSPASSYSSKLIEYE